MNLCVVEGGNGLDSCIRCFRECVECELIFGFFEQVVRLSFDFLIVGMNLEFVDF